MPQGSVLGPLLFLLYTSELFSILENKKLNASKTKTMMVSRSRTMHPQSPPLTIGGTALKESDAIVILGATFDSKMTF